MQIPTDKIREVIGSGGKVIREIVEVSGAKVDINDDGIIKIASPNGEAIQKAYDMIHSIVAEPEEGKIYKGKVVKIVDFGAFVNFFGKRDGLVHVSQIENRRLNHPSDVLKEGQEVWVKLLGFDDRGKVRLAMKMVDQETGEEMKKEDADGMPGGPENPLGARALYLYEGGRDTFLRIHGTPQPWSIGTSASSGCVRMVNAHIMDMYEGVELGATAHLYPPV
jgi:predicted RNA-binding protein with RPS1 domain